MLNYRNKQRSEDRRRRGYMDGMGVSGKRHPSQTD